LVFWTFFTPSFLVSLSSLFLLSSTLPDFVFCFLFPPTPNHRKNFEEATVPVCATGPMTKLPFFPPRTAKTQLCLGLWSPLVSSHSPPNVESLPPNPQPPCPVFADGFLLNAEFLSLRTFLTSVPALLGFLENTGWACSFFRPLNPLQHCLRLSRIFF